MKYGSKCDWTFTSSSPCQFLESSFLMTLTWMHSNFLLFWATAWVALQVPTEIWAGERETGLHYFLYPRHPGTPLSHVHCSHITVPTASELAAIGLPTTWPQDAVWLCPFTTPAQVAGISLSGFPLWRCEDWDCVIQCFPFLPMGWHPSLGKITPPAPSSQWPSVQLQLVSSTMWLQTCWWLRASA